MALKSADRRGGPFATLMYQVFHLNHLLWESNRMRVQNQSDRISSKQVSKGAETTRNANPDQLRVNDLSAGLCHNLTINCDNDYGHTSKCLKMDFRVETGSKSTANAGPKCACLPVRPSNWPRTFAFPRIGRTAYCWRAIMAYSSGRHCCVARIRWTFSLDESV